MYTSAAQLRLSLSELDRRWSDILEGRVYHGEAINPKNLSIWERMTGVGKVQILCTSFNSDDSVFPSLRASTTPGAAAVLVRIWAHG